MTTDNYADYFDSQTGESTGFVALSSWDTRLADILPQVLGTPALNERGIPLLAAREWWHGLMNSQIAQHLKYRQRNNAHLETSWLEAKQAVSAEIPFDTLAPTMTVPVATVALQKLALFQSYLTWTIRSPDDVELDLPNLDSSNAPKAMYEYWSRLSRNAQALEYSPLAAGYLTGVVERRIQDDIAADLGGEHNNDLCKFIICPHSASHFSSIVLSQLPWENVLPNSSHFMQLNEFQSQTHTRFPISRESLPISLNRGMMMTLQRPSIRPPHS